MAHKFVATKIIKELQHSLESLEIDIEKYEELRQENIKLKKELADKTILYNTMEQEMTVQRDELTNMSKVSMIQSINKQLEEKISYIKILEHQLDKFRAKKPIVEPTEVSTEVSTLVSTLVSTEVSTLVSTLVSTEVSTLATSLFDPEEFEEINGYELLVYKKNYYLRDLETDELYSIQSNKPNKVVGLINNKGKVKLQ